MRCVECEGAEGVESEGARVHVHKGMQSVRVCSVRMCSVRMCRVRMQGYM